ncbi:MAG: NAD(P)H-flavin reductase [Osedax symbiont Rs1]|nr:MAG: NAD(P)H-flavin reductase [Osedax symbiont Rs1]
MKKVNCSIESVQKLNHDVYQVKLLLPEMNDQNIEYRAGQYLDLFLASGKSASFSIGSAPEAGRHLELHIRHNPQSEISNALLAHLQNETAIEVEIAKGSACITADSLVAKDRVILAAASTGFSQVKSVVEHLLAQAVSNQIHIYWGVRVASDLYWSLLAESWAAEHSNITYHPVISDPTEACEWTGRVDLLPAAVLQDFSDFSDVKMLASGSPDMVYALLDACESKGMLESQLVSDVLAYAPRNKKS